MRPFPLIRLPPLPSRLGNWVVVVLCLVACDPARVVFPPGAVVSAGTWGGEDAGMIVDDTSAHVHIQCTLGNVSGPIELDSLGRFAVTGIYNVDAYPVDRGILHPARFEGHTDGKTLTLTVTLTDTARVLGPVELELGRDPGMVNCPICRPGRQVQAPPRRSMQRTIPEYGARHSPY